MKSKSTITGVLVALIAGLLIHMINTAKTPTDHIVLALLLVIPVGYVGIKYRIGSARVEQFRSNSLNRYRRNFNHYKRLIKKTP